jgi:hypothetical protein
MDIPEYYKQFQNQPLKKEEEAKRSEQKEQPSKQPVQKQETQKPSQAPQAYDKTVFFLGKWVALSLLE